MTVNDIIKTIEEIAPLDYSENFDNVGLLVGDPNQNVSGALITLDTLEVVVDEAIELNTNLIISFHPIVFNGLKKLTGKNYVEKVVIKAIKNDISIYAVHTALDNSFLGVNAKICEVLGLNNKKILLPKPGVLYSLKTYVPYSYVEKVRDALFSEGAGEIGNYYNASFNFDGIGTFIGLDKSSPHTGEPNELHKEPETCISVVFESHKKAKVIKKLLTSHPYEEVAYEVFNLDNTTNHIGMGMIGDFEEPMEEDNFLKFIKKTFKTGFIRHSKKINKLIQKVAVLGGAGSFAVDRAISLGADAFISADFKYHEFYKAEDFILIADVGHFESEQFTKNLIFDYLKKKFPNFAFKISEKNTNPIYYL